MLQIRRDNEINFHIMYVLLIIILYLLIFNKPYIQLYTNIS